MTPQNKLYEADIDKYLEIKYPITKGMSQKNCNKALRSRHYFKEGYFSAIKTHVVKNTYTINDMRSAYDAAVFNPNGQTFNEWIKQLHTAYEQSIEQPEAIACDSSSNDVPLFIDWLDKYFIHAGNDDLYKRKDNGKIEPQRKLYGDYSRAFKIIPGNPIQQPEAIAGEKTIEETDAHKYAEHRWMQSQGEFSFRDFMEGADFASQQTSAKDKEIKELKEAISELIQVKDWKDKNGKDEHYLKAMPIAWENVRKLIQK